MRGSAPALRKETPVSRWTIRLLALLVLLVPGSSHALEFDCVGSTCPAIEILGDAPSTLPNGGASPFSGFADPGIRRDPGSGELWMTYSWPYLGAVDTARRRRPIRPRALVPGVDVHLARSDDGGATWSFAGPLWSAIAARSPDGVAGRMGHEVANLLSVATSEGVRWYGARLQYFMLHGLPRQDARHEGERPGALCHRCLG